MATSDNHEQAETLHPEAASDAREYQEGKPTDTRCVDEPLPAQIISPEIADMLLKGGRYYSTKVYVQAVEMAGSFRVENPIGGENGQPGDYLLKTDNGRLTVITAEEFAEGFKPSRKPTQ